MRSSGVITSYSIHYTKLYDVPPELNGGKLDPELLGEALAATLSNLGAPKRQRRAFLRLYAGGALSDFTRLESTACDQVGIGGCRADAIGIGPVLGLRVQPFGGVPLAFA